MEEIDERIAWRRRGVHRAYLGALSAGSEGIRLTGRDPLTGIDVALSIPLAEVEHVDVTDAGDEILSDDRCVVLDLAESEAIVLRPVESSLVHIQQLARSLGALAHVPALVAGGHP
jgi:hypothetical protein